MPAIKARTINAMSMTLSMETTNCHTCAHHSHLRNLRQIRLQTMGLHGLEAGWVRGGEGLEIEW